MSPSPSPSPSPSSSPAAPRSPGNATLACVLLLAGPSAAVASSPTVLVKVGDEVPDVGMVLSVEDVAVGDDGSWLARVRTDFANPARDEVILRDGQPWLREGEPLPDGRRLIEDLAGHLSLDAWDVAWAVLRDTGGDAGPHAGLVVAGQPVLVAGDPAVFGPLPAGSTWSDLTLAAPFVAGGAIVRGAVDDGAGLRDVLVRVDPATGDGGGNPTVAARLVAGQSLPRLGVVGRIPAAGAEAVAVAADGAILATIDLEGESAAVDGVLLQWTPADGWSPLAREGDPSPLAGRTWSGLQGRAVAAGPCGDWAVQGSVSGSPASNQVLVRNGDVIHQEGDILALEGGDVLLQGFGAGPLRLLPDGRLAWLADWDATIGFDRGIFVGAALVLRAGTTRFDGVPFGERTQDQVLLSGLDLGPANWRVSPSGAWLVARGTVRDPVTGADLEAAMRVLVLPPCAADRDGDGTVGFGDLVRVLGAYGSADDPADVDGDRDVDFADLVLVLTTWGGCR